MMRHRTSVRANLRRYGERALAAGRGRFARTADDGESGQILLLTIAYGLLALALVLVLASASAVHIERKQLLALADAAALDAADAIDLDLFYGDGFSAGDIDGEGLSALTVGQGEGPSEGQWPAVPLTDATVRDAVAAHLAAAPAAAGLTGLGVGEPTGTPDGVTAQVTLTAVARPPFLPWAIVAWSDGIALRATTTARAG